MAIIAIVDDNLDCCKLLERLLRDVGHVGIYISVAEHAVKSLKEIKPDLLVLDLMMPDISGIDLLRTLRSEPLLRGLPVVIYSAVTDSEMQAQAIQLGARDFIVKGFDWEMVLTRIQRHLPNAAPGTTV